MGIPFSLRGRPDKKGTKQIKCPSCGREIADFIVKTAKEGPHRGEVRKLCPFCKMDVTNELEKI